VVSDKIASKAKTSLSKLINASGSERLVYLMQLLTILSKETNPNYISLTHSFEFDSSENDRINAIYNYSLSHFKRKIYLKDVASIANLSTNSFCRYFKSRAKKSYSVFIIELRVGYACKLLGEKNLSIKEICFASGFNTFTNFNKQFKTLKGMQPNEYRKRMGLE
jgi:AraC-like DNA-binding protein